MKKLIASTTLLLLSLGGQAQLTHDAWMDSIQSESYIGMEITMEDMALSSTRIAGESAMVGFYKNNPLNSTEEILSRLSGISMVRRGNYAWEPTINGLSGGQVNVSIDGMRMFGACTDKMDPVSSYVEPNNMESIAVEKGGYGSEHGCTVGGTVAFNLKQPKFDKGWNGNINSRYESVSNGMSHSASLNYGADKLAVRMNGGYRKFGNYTDGDGKQVNHSGYKKFNFSLAAAYRTRNNGLLNLDILIDDARDIGYPALPMDVAFAKANMAGITYTIWNPIPLIDQLEIKGYVNTVNHLMDDTKRENLVIHMDMPGNTKTVGAFVTADISHAQHRIKAKFDWYSTAAIADMVMYVDGELDMYMQTWPDAKRHVAGVFISDQWAISEGFSLKSNARIDFGVSSMQSEMGKQQFTVFGYEEGDFISNQLLFNLGSTAQYQLNRQWTSTLTLSYGERLPSVSEQYGFYLYSSFDGYDYIGAPTISKESSIQATGGISFQPNQKLQLKVDGFHYWFDDYIIGIIDPVLDAMTIGAKGVKAYQNIAGVTFSGFNGQVIYQPTPAIQVLYAIKATFATDGNDQPLPMIPPLKQNLTLVGQWKDFKLQVEGEYARQQDKISVEAGEQMTNAYFIANARLNKTLQLGKSTFGLSVGVENLLDEAYREHLDWGGILRPGRNYYASLKFNF